MRPETRDDLENAAGVASIAGGTVAAAKSVPYVTGRRTYFHGTSRKHAEKILAGQGIRPAETTGAEGVLNAGGEDSLFPKEWRKHAYVSESRLKGWNYAAQSAMHTNTKPVLLKVSARDWGEGPGRKRGMKLMENPETAGGYEAMAKRISERLEKDNPAMAKQIRKDPSMIKAAHKIQSWGGEKATPGVSSRRIKGSKNYQKLTLKEVGAYAQARPMRFLKGAGMAGLGAGAIAGGAYLLGKKENQMSAHDELNQILFSEHAKARAKAVAGDTLVHAGMGAGASGLSTAIYNKLVSGRYPKRAILAAMAAGGTIGAGIGAIRGSTRPVQYSARGELGTICFGLLSGLFGRSALGMESAGAGMFAKKRLATMGKIPTRPPFGTSPGKAIGGAQDWESFGKRNPTFEGSLAGGGGGSNINWRKEQLPFSSRDEMDTILFAKKKVKIEKKCPECGMPMSKCKCAGYSARRELNEITLQDPRPRDDLGMFSGGGGGGEPGTDPMAIHVAYKMPMGAPAEAPPEGEEEEGGATKKLKAKLKGKKKEMSDESSVIQFGLFDGIGRLFGGLGSKVGGLGSKIGQIGSNVGSRAVAAGKHFLPEFAEHEFPGSGSAIHGAMVGGPHMLQYGKAQLGLATAPSRYKPGLNPFANTMNRLQSPYGMKYEFSARGELNSIIEFMGPQSGYWNDEPDYRPQRMGSDLVQAGTGAALGLGLMAGVAAVPGAMLGYKGFKKAGAAMGWMKNAPGKFKRRFNWPVGRSRSPAMTPPRTPAEPLINSAREDLRTILFGYYDNDEEDSGLHIPVFGAAGGALGGAYGAYKGATLPGRMRANRMQELLDKKKSFREYHGPPSGNMAPMQDPAAFRARKQAHFAGRENVPIGQGPKVGPLRYQGRGMFGNLKRGISRAKLGKGVMGIGRGWMGIGGALLGTWLGSSLGGQLDDASR